MPADPPLLTLQAISLTLGTTPLLDGAELNLGAQDRVALVGRNGSGKSTLLRIAAGLVAPDRGRRFLQPGATLRYLPQDPDLSGHANVRSFIQAGLAPGDDLNRARWLLEQLGLSGDEAPSRLSGGEARRAALVQVLAADPDLLLLDEPTNHLDLPAIEWLQTILAKRRGGLILISHDRAFLTALSRAMVWLDRGITRRLDRGFDQFETWRDETLDQEARDQHKLDRKIAAEEDWVRYGVTARRKRNVRRMAELGKLREARRQATTPLGRTQLQAQAGALSGRQVIVADRIGVAFAGPPIIRDLDVIVLRGDRIAIVGPNGAGKTTLLKLLTGALSPDTGTVTLGTDLRMLTLDQRRDALDPDRTVAETLTGGSGDTVRVRGTPRHVVGYMKEFLFLPEQARTPTRVLSGGEKARLLLARVLAEDTNFLILDEPTNDLDLETLDLLQELLADYPGTVLFVSHDRAFIDRVATATIAFAGDGRWVLHAGGYSDIVARSVPSAAVPKSTAAPQARAPDKLPAKHPGAGKLGFKDQHLLSVLPGQIAAMRQEIEALNAGLMDATLYQRDPVAFTTLTERLAALGTKLAAAEDTWLDLEIRREALQS